MARALLRLAASFSLLLFYASGYAGELQDMMDPGKGDELPKNGPNVTFKGCSYYEHASFKGQQHDIQFGHPANYVGAKWNDKISSIECSAGCGLQVWEHRDFKGASRTFSGATAYVGNAWNDRISSLKVVCR